MSELKAGVIVTPHNEGMCFNQGSDTIAVIERETEFYLKSEVDKIIAEKDREIARLKEAQRWRKYSEEKPKSDGYYIICGSSGFRNADRFMQCKDGRGMDFSFYSYGVEYWMPMPAAPKEEK